MATVVYKPQDDRWGSLGRAIGAGVAGYGKGKYMKKQDAEEKMRFIEKLTADLATARKQRELQRELADLEMQKVDKRLEASRKELEATLRSQEGRVDKKIASAEKIAGESEAGKTARQKAAIQANKDSQRSEQIDKAITREDVQEHEKEMQKLRSEFELSLFKKRQELKNEEDITKRQLGFSKWVEEQIDRYEGADPATMRLILRNMYITADKYGVDIPDIDIKEDSSWKPLEKFFGFTSTGSFVPTEDTPAAQPQTFDDSGILWDED